MVEARPRMKLFIDPEKNLLFAEGGKECVDFFFRILAMPVGSVTTRETGGSLGKLHESLQNLDITCIQPNQKKDIFLKPELPRGPKGGLVRGSVKYMISDDFTVKPMPSLSDIIALLKRRGIKGVDVLREEEVKLGEEEAKKLLKTALEHKGVLTRVFKDIISK